MTAPDTRDSVERIVAEMLAVGFHEEIFGERAHDWADRLSAIPQQAGGEDYSALKTRLRDSAMLSTLPEWCRKELEQGADAIAALQAEVARLSGERDNWRKDCEQMHESANWWGEMAVEQRARAEAAEAALREAHTLPETWRNKWDGGCCCDAAGHECADALDAALGGTGDA